MSNEVSNDIIPLRKRYLDIAILGYFLVNILFITYIVDIEQLIIPNPYHFTYPIWPLPFMVNIIHWYGRTFDPLLMARPVWWKMTILNDAVFFGPFYIFAIYAFIKGKNWIRNPSLIYSSVLLTNVLIILSEEIYGPYASPQLAVVIGVNLPWLVFPALLIIRMWKSDCPFTLTKNTQELTNCLNEKLIIPDNSISEVLSE